MKKRNRVGHGYAAQYDLVTGRILRVVDDNLTHSHTPELFDIEITNSCPNECPYCYMDSSSQGTKLMSLETITSLFEKHLDRHGNLLPFQIAYGGGEPTSHPEFSEILKYTRSLDIIPNYTTSGKGINPMTLINTEKYCGGIALTYHPHLEDLFKDSLSMMNEVLNRVKVNVHLVVTSKNIEMIHTLLTKHSSKFDKLVLINFKPLGRGSDQEDNLFDKAAEQELVEMVKKFVDTGRLAFDAGLIPFFTSYHKEFNRTYEQIAPNFINIEGKYNAFIDVDFNLKPSSFYSGQGINLHEEDLLDSWNNHSIFTGLRNHQQSAEGPCENCEVFDLCKGGIYDPNILNIDKVNFCKHKKEKEDYENFIIH